MVSAAGVNPLSDKRSTRIRRNSEMNNVGKCRPESRAKARKRVLNWLCPRKENRIVGIPKDQRILTKNLMILSMDGVFSIGYNNRYQRPGNDGIDRQPDVTPIACTSSFYGVIRLV